MARRSSSEGTIYQLPSGRWRAQISIHGKRWSATRPTKVLAREWIRQVSEQADQGLTYEGSQVRLGKFLVDWLETKSGHLRNSTQESYRTMAHVYILPYLERYKLSDLTRGIIQQWVNTLNDKTGDRTIQIAHMVLHNALQHALQLGLISRNPSEMILIPKRDNAEMQVWTENQVSQFLIGIRGDANENLYHLALATGMRRGEMLGLKWADIDWSGRIQVNRQAIRGDGPGYTFGEPKTNRGRRSVEIGPVSINRLRDQEKRVHELRKVFYRSWTENDLVFPTQRGSPHCGGNIVKQFRKLCLKSGVPVIRFHDLRHTAATIMLSHGIPPVIVAGMLGHTLSVLMTRYAHYIPTMQGEAARLMDELMGQVDMHEAFSITHELPTKEK